MNPTDNELLTVAPHLTEINALIKHAHSSDKRTVYYAHCMDIYNTQQEKRDIETLANLGLIVVNPNSKQVQAQYNSNPDFELFVNLVRHCDLFAFRGLMGGIVPSGVGKELEAARGLNKPIIELPSYVNRKFLTVEETREYLHENGQR